MLPYKEWLKVNRKRFLFGDSPKARKAYLIEQEKKAMSITTLDFAIVEPKVMVQTSPHSHSFSTPVICEKPSSFADCKKAPCQPPAIDWSCYQEGNNPMNYASATVTTPPTETQDQRKYLEKRLESIYYEKKEPLYAHFGLEDDGAPTSPKDFMDRIKNGKFQVRGVDFDVEHASRYDGWYWTELLVWRDPAKKADREGYDAAIKDLKAQRQVALDTIKIDEPKAGLDAIKALEAWEPAGKAS